MADDALSVATAIEDDFGKLIELNLGRYPELGKPVDSSKMGPLGSLWPLDVPSWS